MDYQRNKKIYVSQRQNLPTNDKEERSTDKNRKTQNILKISKKITDLLKTSKQAHYYKHFEENKKNFRALWIGIRNCLF